MDKWIAARQDIQIGKQTERQREGDRIGRESFGQMDHFYRSSKPVLRFN